MHHAASLLPGLADASVRVGADRLAGEELAASVGNLAAFLHGRRRVAVWATPSVRTAVAVAGSVVAGVPVVPLDPRAAPAELTHLVTDSHPELVLATPTAVLPPPVGGLPRADPLAVPSGTPPAEPAGSEAPALVMYTSGTTGPPKGAVIPRRAVAACLDGLAEAWAWTRDDVLVHALPLFHVHGLVLGLLGPLRIGAAVHHVGRFSPAALASGVTGGGTVVFGVPTMWSRVAADPVAARALRPARLLVSGSAGLARPTYDALAHLIGQGPVERYGLTEALIVAAARADEPRVAGVVGRALPGVGLRLADEQDGVGDLELSGPTLFSGYLHKPEATSAAMTTDGWLRTGDLGALDHDGQLRILGRRATDLVMTGGHRVGAGEIEAALLLHPGVHDVAVIGEPDDDLGERVVAYVVAEHVTAAQLTEHCASLLAAYKRPRVYRMVEELPRNALGKLLKTVLRDLS